MDGWGCDLYCASLRNTLGTPPADSPCAANSGGSRFAAAEEGEPAFEGRTVAVVPDEHARRLPRTSIMIASRARNAQMGTGGVRVMEGPVEDDVQSKGASEERCSTVKGYHAAEAASSWIWVHRPHRRRASAY
jgi:hypothetical protein